MNINICIIVPSHIASASRTKTLILCLESLINQSKPIPIYLSISFESDLDKIIFKKTIEKNNLINNNKLNIIYQQVKTSQFRHIEKVIDIIKNKYNFVMFCDDDDTYNIERVEKFISMIEYGNHSQVNFSKDKIFVGCYERDGTKTHNDKFYEYWAYCVNIDFINKFFTIIKKNNIYKYINHKFCDLLFTYYLTNLNSNHMFTSISEKLYNYNIYDNSVCGKMINDFKNKKNIETESINMLNLKTFKEYFEEYIKELNKHIENNIDIYKNNMFIKISQNYESSITFEKMLEFMLKTDYKFKNKIDKKILDILSLEYDNIKSICKVLKLEDILE
jgi:hypothetical protein